MSKKKDSKREYEYSPEYKVKEIGSQVDDIASIFDLNPYHAHEFIKKLPENLPKGSESWFAFPKISVIAEKYSKNGVVENAYKEATLLVLDKISELFNERGILLFAGLSFVTFEKNIPDNFGLCQKTSDFISRVESSQEGDIVIFAAQHGERHLGKTVKEAIKSFFSNEFGLGVFHAFCMGLASYNRYPYGKGDMSYMINTDCPGDLSESTLSYSGNFIWVDLPDGDYDYDKEGWGSITGFALND